MVFRPTTFGKYVFLKRIAIGGMAEVFRAKSFGAEGFEKLAAVKRMLPHLSSDSQFVDMFIDEAKLAANLNHANIAQIYDFGCIDNLYFISMEFCHGKDIADIIRMLRDRNLTAPLELACYIFIEVLSGLDYAHRQRDAFGNPLNLIHRDVSPHNIICSYEGEVKLVDFGIAKATSSSVQTTGGVLKGKYSYMSPEQAHGMPLDHRSDIFSLGICFYETLTLTKMFHADSDLGVLEMVRETEFIPPRELNPAIPEELNAILLKALEKNPDDRYSTAGEMRSELERFLFSNNLHFSAAWLADFMREIFREELDREQDDTADEAEIVKKLRSEARRAARLEAAGAGPNTVIVARHIEPEPTSVTGASFMDEEEEDEPEDLDVEVEGAPTEFDGDSYEDRRKKREEGRLIVVDDDQFVDSGADTEEKDEPLKGQRTDEDEDEDFEEEAQLLTSKLDRPAFAEASAGRPDSDVFELKATSPARVAKLKRKPPIREISKPPSRPGSGRRVPGAPNSEPAINETTREPLAAAAYDSGRPTERTTGRQTFEEPIKAATEQDLALQLESLESDEGTISSVRRKRFPTSTVLFILVLVLVGGGVTAYVFHDRDSTDSGTGAAVEKATGKPRVSFPRRRSDSIGKPKETPTPAKPATEAKAEPVKPRITEAKVTVPPATPPSEAKPEVEVAAKTKKSKKNFPKHKRKRRVKKKIRRKPKPAVVKKEEPAGWGRLDVGVSGSWAFVYIDGVKIRTTPLLNYRMRSGMHKVELKDGEGQVIRRWRIRLKPNERVKLLHQ